MWRECSVVFAAAVRALARDERPPEGSELAAAFEDAANDPSLVRPRPPITSALGSSVLFSLGKASLACRGAGPEELARRLLTHLEPAAHGYFTFSIARGGYVNADFTAEGKRAFFSAYSSSEEKFSRKSLLPWPLCGLEAPTGSRDFSFSWSGVLERYRDEGGEDCARLAGVPDARQMKIMVLGALADPEIDVRRYLNGMKGKENLPWLFERFDADTSAAVAAAEPGAGGSADEVADTFLRQVEEALLWPRYAAATGARHNRPEELMLCLLQLVRLFYSFYGRPDFRRTLGGGLDAAASAEIRRAVAVLSGCVREGLALLDLSR